MMKTRSAKKTEAKRKAKNESAPKLASKPLSKETQSTCDIKFHEKINVVQYLNRREAGKHLRENIKKKIFIKNISQFQETSIVSPFTRRVTAISWNTVNSNLVAMGSKGGELALFNIHLSVDANCQFIHGSGPADSITALKFHNTPSSIFTSSVNGTVMIHDFEGQLSLTLMQVSDDNWFSSLDVLKEKKIVIVGDCKGNIYFKGITGEKIIRTKIHKSKIRHIESCPQKTDLIATASVDHTVKLWDLRMMSENNSEPIHVFLHDRAVNSVCFSPSNSYSFLTTDQYDELRVYNTNLFHLQTSIKHPHRQFQYVTPINASWHPFEDIVVVGRFPQQQNSLKEDPCLRTIDFYDAYNGELLYNLHPKMIQGIAALNYFNDAGDTLISGSGRHLTFWQSQPYCDEL